MSTILARRYSPSALACGSCRVEAGHPLFQQSVEDEVEAPDVGQVVAIHPVLGGLTMSSASRSTVRKSDSHQ